MVEFALQLTFPEKLVSPFEFHPQYIYSLKPNYSGKFTRLEVNGGEVRTWKSNRQSYRGNELRVEANFKIVVYGDSNIQAVFSRLEDTYTSKLENYLKRVSGKDVEVINAGVMGYGPDQNLLRLAAEADKLQPDMVIFHVNPANDFGDLLRNRLFDVVGGKLVRRADTISQQKKSIVQQSADFAASLLISRAAKKSGENSYLSGSAREQKRLLLKAGQRR